MHLKYLNILIILGIMALASCHPKPANEQQQWTAAVTSWQSDCQKIGKNLEGNYQLLVERGPSDTLTLTVVKSGHVLKGVKSETDTTLFNFTASYAEGGGILAETMEITLSAPGVGTGKSQWSWSNGFQTCRGNYTFTVTKNE